MTVVFSFAPSLTSASIISFRFLWSCSYLGPLLCLPQACWPHSFWSFHPLVPLHFSPLFLFSSLHKAKFHCLLLSARASFSFSATLTLNSTFAFHHIHSKIHNWLVLISESKSTVVLFPFKLLLSFGNCCSFYLLLSS